MNFFNLQSLKIIFNFWIMFNMFKQKSKTYYCFSNQGQLEVRIKKTRVKHIGLFINLKLFCYI